MRLPPLSLGPLMRTGRARRITLEVVFGALFLGGLLYLVERASHLSLGITAFDGPEVKFGLLLWSFSFEAPLPLWLTFLDGTVGFPVGTQWLTGTTAGSTRFEAYSTGVWNTVRLVIVGILFATIIGVVAGVARLSSNWLVSRVATLYVEVIRNTPLVIQIVFWYTAVFLQLPQIASPIEILGLGFLSNRGLTMPWFEGAVRELAWGAGLALAFVLAAQSSGPRWFLRLGLSRRAGRYLAAGLVFAAVAGFTDIVTGAPLRDSSAGELAWGSLVALALAGGYVVRRWRSAREEEQGTPQHANRWGLALAAGGLAAAYAVTLFPVTLDVPELTRSATGVTRTQGGLTATPEFVGLLLGLVIYTGAFIAEIVRGGIQALSRGQTEAGMAVGLSGYDRMTLVILPQALRIIIPPLTNQYLNLLKNSSLAAFIAYADLLGVARTIINDIGRAVPLFLMVLITYQLMSWLIAAVMNGLNARVQLVGR